MEVWQAILFSASLSAISVFSVYLLTKRDRRIGREADHAAWVGEVNADRKWLKRTVESIRETVADILWYLSGGALSRNSPLQLTDFGKKISRDLEARKWSERLCRSGQLRIEIQGMSHREVDEFCLNFVLTRLNPNDQERRALENCARDNGVSIAVVRRVLAGELRDTLMPLEQG